MYSNGNSFGESAGSSFGDSIGNSIASGRRVPPWKFGVGPAAMWGDRGSM